MQMSRLTWALLLLTTGCLVEKLSSYRLDGPVPSDEEGFANALYQATGTKLVPGNAVELVNDAPLFDAMAAEFEHAERSIDVATFIWRPGDPSDRLLPVIAARARAGVKCRVLVDRFASSGFVERVEPMLESAGCQVRHARPEVSADRNHRKLYLVDGRVAFTGGAGIAKDWLEWRDTNVRIEGPVVAQLQQAFAENWIEETGTLLPRESFPPLERKGPLLAGFVTSRKTTHVTAAERLTHLAIAAAKKRVWIANAYFVPSAGLTELMKEQRQRGVDVRVMTPSDTTDQLQVLAMQRRHYPELLGAGVRLFEYQPNMFHTKTMLVDDDIVVVGSINLDKLSQDLLDEGSLVVFDAAFAKRLEKDWLDDERRCKEMGGTAAATPRR